MNETTVILPGKKPVQIEGIKSNSTHHLAKDCHLLSDSCSIHYTLRTNLAGFPYHNSPAGTSCVTTLPIPIIAFSPMVIPPMIEEPPPIVAPFLIVIGSKSKGRFERGYLSLVNVTFEPINALSSIVIPSHICTPFFIVTLLPIRTSFSIIQ